jgi:cobalt-zinc-cadmium efflux system outer membrane protein
VSACGTIRPKPGFDDVQHLLASRTSGVITWNAGDAESRAIDERVSILLREELTPQSAVQIALLRNRSLQATYGRLGIAQADLVQAGLLQNPILTADVRFGINGGTTGAAIGVVQEFVSVLQIPLRKRVAAASFEATKLEVAAAALDLALRVRSGFYELQGAEQMLELRHQIVEADTAAAELATRQHTAGDITDLDLANAQALADQARIDLAEAEAAALVRHEELTALLGLWGNETDWRIGHRLPELPPEEIASEGLESRAVSQRLDLAAAAQARVVSTQNVALTRFYGLVPEASAGAEAEREVESGIWSLGPSVSLPIPLFDQRQAALASMRSQLAQAEDRYAALAVEIRSEVRRARLRMQAARARAEYYRRVLIPLRTRITDETLREYNGMLVGVFQLLQARRDEADAARRYVEALTEYWASRTELERAVGGDLPVVTASAPTAMPTRSSPQQHHHHGG